MPGAYLEMGALGRPHGIKGEISANWRGAAIPKPGDNILLRAGDNPPESWKIAASRVHNGRLLLSLEGVKDRTEAEKLKGRALLMPRDLLPQPEEDEAFVADLPGCKVLLADGAFLGDLERVEFPAGQMIWSIRDAEGREILFPANPAFIKGINAAKREAIIDPPPGLLEIYQGDASRKE